MKQSEAIIGAGPEWIEQLEAEVTERLHELRCLELIPENFFSYPDRFAFLDKLAEAGVPVLVHAVGMSLATDEPLKTDHLEKVMEVADRVNAVNLSEHLSMTEAGGIDIGQLTPVPWSYKSADVVSRKIERIMKRANLPFALEHVAYRFFYPETELSETTYINLILERTGCDLMLDLHNLYCNSKNAGYDPLQWLEEIRLDRVTSIHLAGGFQTPDGTYQDGHNYPVPNPVWDLLEHVLKRITPQTIIVERTGNYPGLDAVMAEVNKANSLLNDALKRKGLYLPNDCRTGLLEMAS